MMVFERIQTYGVMQDIDIIQLFFLLIFLTQYNIHSKQINTNMCLHFEVPYKNQLMFRKPDRSITNIERDWFI